MIGLGLSLSIGSQQAVSGGAAAPAAPTATITMAQISTNDTKRIYQRSTQSGGGQGNGQGTIPVTISGALAGTINARCSSGGATRGDLQAEWQAATIANSATTANISGVDARLGWFYLDLKDTTGTWQNGTTLVGMGALFGFAGQSLMQRFIGRFVSDTGTYVSNSLTANANSSVLATYSDGSGGGYQPTVSTMPWQLPGDMADNTGPSSTGIGELLNRMIAMLGVNCGGIGYAQGQSSILTFMSGQANWTQLSAVLSRAGGAFEGFHWGQGHSDSLVGCPANGYSDLLTQFFTLLTAANSFSGYKKYLWSIPAVASNAWGTSWEMLQVRKGAEAWCVANSATHVNMQDFARIDAAVHESQTGAITMAREMYRATRANYGQTSGTGPVPLSATRSGTTITVTVSDVGQTALSLVGSPKNRIFVFPTGKYSNSAAPNDNRFPVSAVSSPNKTTLTLTLANDPGDGNVLDLYFYYPGDGVGDATLDNIYDNRTDSDGIATGRLLQQNSTAITIAAPVPASTVNAAPTVVANTSPYNLTATSATYGTGRTGFGSEITGGYAQCASSTPNIPAITQECFFTCPTISGSVQVLCGGGPARDYIAVDATGKLTTATGATGATTLVAGKRYHVAKVGGPTGERLYLTNITDSGSGVRDYNSATAYSQWNSLTFGSYNVRTFNNGTFPLSGGAVDEYAIWRGEKYSGTTYTMPSAPYVGTETDLIALYHLDSNVVSAVGA